MIPWERDVYVELLRSHLEEEKLKMQQQQGLMNLDDLLKSIREEDDDSKGGKINAENFKTKTFKKSLNRTVI